MRGRTHGLSRAERGPRLGGRALGAFALGAAVFSACSTAPAPTTAAGPTSNGAPAGGSDRDAEVATPLYGDLGPHRRQINTVSDRAQAYFDEGLLFIYAFGTSVAEASFRAAQREDPSCAACYWGEAWALSPYLNGGMGPGDERKAYAANRRAAELASTASDVERALIEAFSVRFEAEPDGSRRKSLDSLYAREIGKVAERFPADLDVQTLHAEALMLLRPRRGSVDLEAEDVRRILPILEGVLARDIRHPGACHLYIHLMEASPEPERAERCADYLGDAIAVSHIRHMPSHIYVNVGRYADAVRANQRAWQADQRAEHGGPPGVYPAHNLHMLLYAAVLDGQSAVAIQAARDLAREQRSWAWYVPVTLARFGRWEEVLEPADEPDDRFQAAMWRFARGMAHLRTGRPDRAADDLARLRELREETQEGDRFRFHDARALLEIPAGILGAELAHAAGRGDEAIALLERVVEAEEGLTYDEPAPWHLPGRLVLGAVLLDLGSPARAETVYRDALETHPNTGWALFGLEQALREQGKSREADRTRSEFERHWTRADVWLRASRF